MKWKSQRSDSPAQSQALRKNRQRGQVAIFVALIFQVLFVFFAMMVNVGLLVHHKINLQNSVDIAAYYGAMKQAEILNVIAHANYQIRQSWKLMVFRYRHLGAYGDITYPGARNGAGDQSNTAGSLVPAFCITYSPFNFMNANEDYCKYSAQGGTFIIKQPPIPSFVAPNFLGLWAFQGVNIAVTQAVQATITKSCEEKQGLSLYALARFIWAYKRDIANRKRLILTLANQLSSSSTDFTDIDGTSAADGIKATLTKNLTYQNQAGLQRTAIWNSMGHQACKATGTQWQPPPWLSEIMIYPVFWAFMGECTNTALTFAASPINTTAGQANIPPAVLSDPLVGSAIQTMLPEVGENDGTVPQANLNHSSLGFEKDPWCMAYVGVEAETTPKIPFSPFGSIKLTATAYAKPFGGTIGPWNRSVWAAGTPYSKGGNEIDTVAPPRIYPPDAWTNATDPRLVADAIRYVGDTIGTKSDMNMFQYATAINQFSAGTMNLTWWDHLIDPGNDLDIAGPNGSVANGDQLAWPNKGDTAVALKMRNLEIAAIAPDQYDLSYYSVEPDYFRNYFSRLIKQIGKAYNFSIRGDLGQRIGDSQWGTFSIKDQMANTKQNALLNTSDVLTYYAQDFSELLTSFKAMEPDNQVMDPNNFGKCSVKVGDQDPQAKATTGNCIAGGRVGYSVKLIDGDFLNSSALPMGGTTTSGPLQNPPPGF